MSELNPVFDPLQRKMVSGPEGGENTTVDGFQVNFTGSTTGGVYNAGPGLTLSGNVFSADVADVGFGLQLDGGTASYARYRSIETVTGGTVTLMAGHAYKAYATTSPLTITAEDIPADKYGQEGHLEIYLANASYVVADPQKVVLRDALEPDSVNNLTCRFHDGLCILSVEDHIAGYIVISSTGTAAGSLPYAISSATQDYVAFDATTNGAAIDLAGAVANGEKHLVGNGYTSTTLTGAVDCGTSKFTVANIELQDVVVNGGTMTFGDAFIPSGSTVTAAGGNFMTERLVGDGGVVYLGNTATPLIKGSDAYMSGIIMSGFSRSLGTASGGITLGGTYSATIESCWLNGNIGFGAAICLANGAATVTLIGSTISENYTVAVYINARNDGAATLDMSGCTLEANNNVLLTGTSAATAFFPTVKLGGSNRITGKIYGSGASIEYVNGIVKVDSDAIIDLTGNTNSEPIKPGGGIFVADGDATASCTVLVGATVGVVESIVVIVGGTYATIKNDGTTE